MSAPSSMLPPLSRPRWHTSAQECATSLPSENIAQIFYAPFGFLHRGTAQFRRAERLSDLYRRQKTQSKKLSASGSQRASVLGFKPRHYRRHKCTSLRLWVLNLQYLPATESELADGAYVQAEMTTTIAVPHFMRPLGRRSPLGPRRRSDAQEEEINSALHKKAAK